MTCSLEEKIYFMSEKIWYANPPSVQYIIQYLVYCIYSLKSAALIQFFFVKCTQLQWFCLEFFLQIASLIILFWHHTLEKLLDKYLYCKIIYSTTQYECIPMWISTNFWALWLSCHKKWLNCSRCLLLVYVDLVIKKNISECLVRHR